MSMEKKRFTHISLTVLGRAEVCMCKKIGDKLRLAMQGGILFFNGRLIFHILDVENEPRKTSVPS